MMNGKLFALGVVLVLGTLIVSGCGTATPEPTTGLPNPASVYCEGQGYTLEMRTDADGGTYGVCIFPDGSECEEWAFYRGECQPASASEAAMETPEVAPTAEPPAEEKPTEIPTPAPTEVPTEAPDTEQPTGVESAVCWYGRVESTPADAAIDRYLILLPEEARRAVDVVGADETVEAEIEALRDSGTYAHFWGTLDCAVPGWGGCQLVVNRLRPEVPEGPFFDPDPVKGWTGNLFSTPENAQFDDYFVRSGGIPMQYGIESADTTISAQLESLRDAPAIIRVWGQVTCPIIDFQGSQIQVDRVEIVMEASAEEGYEGWKPYLNERFGYAVWYPGECTVMGGNLDDTVQFAAGQEWPVLTVSHYASDFYRPPAGTDLQQWIADHVPSYDQIDTEMEIAGLPAVHLAYEAGPGWDASDDYYFIRGDQLFRISILHLGGQEDWELYDKFLQGFTFP